jgi:hypothetical protein
MIKYFRARYHKAVLNHAANIWSIVELLNRIDDGFDTELCFALGGHNSNFKIAAARGYITLDRAGIARRKQ